jgi:hypothetical protein
LFTFFIFIFFQSRHHGPRGFQSPYSTFYYYTAQHHQSAVSTKKAKNKRDVVALLVCRMRTFDSIERQEMLDWEIPNIYVFINNSTAEKKIDQYQTHIDYMICIKLQS